MKSYFTPGVRYMMLSTVFFALMNVCVKLLPHIPAIEIVFFRALVTLVMSWVMIKRLGLNMWGNNKPLLVYRGLSGAGGLILYFYTVQQMPLASAVTIQYLSPVFTTILAIFILKERMHFMQWAFLGMSFGGVLLIRGFDPRVTGWLLLIGVGSAIFSGLAYNIIRKLKDHDHPLVVVFYFPLVTIPLVTPFVIDQWVTPNGEELALLILVGVFTQFAQVYMTKAYQAEAVANISIITYIGIIYALFIGYFFFDEGYNLLVYAGMALVLAGVVSNLFWKKLYSLFTKS